VPADVFLDALAFFSLRRANMPLQDHVRPIRALALKSRVDAKNPIIVATAYGSYPRARLFQGPQVLICMQAGTSFFGPLRFLSLLDGPL